VPARIALAAALSLSLAAGCTSSSKSSGGTTNATTATSETTATSAATATSTAAVCADYDALKTSLSNLVHINVVNAGRDGIEAALDDVSTKLATLKSSAQQEFTSQIDQLQTAINDLKTTLGNLSGNSLGGTVTTIATQLVAVGNAGRALGSAVAKTCPNATSS
jgi:hypothetical protein